MKQQRKKICVILVAFVLCVTSMAGNTERVYAANANVTVAVSANSVKIGDSISVTINISSGNAIGSYSMAVTYNASVLEYTGGSGSGGGGTVMIADTTQYGTETRLSATLNFRAIANGSSTIATSGGEAYDMDENVLSIVHGGTTITVAAPATTAASTTASTETNASGSSTEASTGTTALDTTLRSLEISPGSLEPSFSSTIQTYTVNVPEDTTEIIVSAAASDSNASVTVSHNDDLEPGANKVYIVVTAEDGSERTYTLNVNCGEVEDKNETIIIQGKTYTFATESDMDSVTIPEDFTLSEATYGDAAITVYESENKLLRIVYLLSEDGEGNWFLYDSETESFAEYIELATSVYRYVILDVPDGVVIPDGYEPVEVSIQGRLVPAYSKDGKEEFVLVYATNLHNEAGFYNYDTVEETFQRYIESLQADTEESTSELVADATKPVTSDSDKVRHLRILLYIISGAAIVILGVLIGIMYEVKKRIST